MNGLAIFMTAASLAGWALESGVSPGPSIATIQQLAGRLLDRDVRVRNVSCNELKQYGWQAIAPVIDVVGKPGGDIFYPATCLMELHDAIDSRVYDQPDIQSVRIWQLGQWARVGANHPEETGGVGIFAGSRPVKGGPAEAAGFPNGFIVEVDGKSRDGVPEVESWLRGPVNSTVSLRVWTNIYSAGPRETVDVIIKRAPMMPSTNQLLSVFREALNDRSPQVRKSGAIALGEAGMTFDGQVPHAIAHSVTKILIPHLSDESPEVVAAVKKAIHSAGTSEGLEALGEKAGRTKN